MEFPPHNLQPPDHRIYLDYNATAPLAPEAFEAMRPYLQGLVGNPSSPHREGQAARRALDAARRRTAGILGAKPQEIVFTSGGSEANALALRGVMRSHVRPGDRCVVGAVEHNSILETAEALAAEGLRVDVAPVGADGRVRPEALKELLTRETALVSVQLVNNETGVIQPVAALAAAVRDAAPRAVFHTDAVQAAGKLPIDVARLGVDLMTLSAHKFHGPRGAGILYVKRGVKVAAQVGGGAQERGRRSGTEDVAVAVGVAEALAIAEAARAGFAERVAKLRDRLERGILEKVGAGRVRPAGQDADRVANTSMLLFAGLDGEALVVRLDMAGLSVSVGSACSTGRTDPSHVLVAMGIAESEALGAIRFSLGRDTTEHQIDRAVELSAREALAMMQP